MNYFQEKQYILASVITSIVMFLFSPRLFWAMPALLYNKVQVWASRSEPELGARLTAGMNSYLRHLGEFSDTDIVCFWVRGVILFLLVWAALSYGSRLKAGEDA